MTYKIKFKPRAIKDLGAMQAAERRRVLHGIEALRNDLSGDVKRLTNFTPEYRLRVGDFRVLFELEGVNVMVYRVLHRKDAYR